MNLQEEIMINKYGQDLIALDTLNEMFSLLDVSQKKLFLHDILYLIIQSKPEHKDIETTIENSELNPNYTPCILIKKGVVKHNLQKILELPANELSKVFILFLNLFKIAYKRRFEIEKNNPDKWWYWDLSTEANINKIERQKK